MGKLIAIGGGPNGGDFDRSLEEKIRNLLHKEQPKVVFIPYASSDFVDNFTEFKRIYEQLGCEVILLKPGKEKILLLADLIYIGRGGTIPLLKKLEDTNAILYVKNAFLNGVTIAGFSAGAHALFTNACSNEENIGFTMVKGLGFINTCIVTHYNYKNRADAFHDMVIKSNISGIGLEDHTMMVMENNIAKIVSSRPEANGYLIEIVDSKLSKTRITGKELILPLQN